MFKNNFVIAWRSLKKNRTSSLINLSGLTAGMAVAVLIGLWIYDELSFNKYHQNYGKIAAVMFNENSEGKNQSSKVHPIPLSDELRSSFKDDFKYVVASTQSIEQIIAAGDKKFRQAGRFMEKDAAEMLSLEMLQGTRAALEEPNSILISESLAGKLFPEENGLGQLVTINSKANVIVKGIYKDLPINSEFKDLSFIVPLKQLFSLYRQLEFQIDNWNFSVLQVYTQISGSTDFRYVSSKIKNVRAIHGDGKAANLSQTVFLHPMSKWHLYSAYDNSTKVVSERMQLVWFSGLIGVFVLLLACINFMNLTTARSEKRAREVGVRKALGSGRKRIISQFFAESILTTFAAFVISLIVVRLLLPWYNELTGKKIEIPWSGPLFWVLALVFILTTGLLAGLYPALYLSSFRPVEVLKGIFRFGRFAFMPRKALVVFQFTISIVLITGTIIVYRQLMYAKDRPVGYDREGMIALTMNTPDIYKNYTILENDLLNSGAVIGISRSSGPITEVHFTNSNFDWKGKAVNSKYEFVVCAITHEYGKTIGWQFLEGRDFSKNYSTDSTGIVINEAASKMMSLKNPMNETVNWEGRNLSIIGIVKDLVMGSPFDQVKPTIFILDNADWAGFINIRLNPELTASSALNKIGKIFQKHNPSAPFDYKFVDDEYAIKFASEERLGKLAGFFAILAIFISCLGLFGLSAFTAERRTKEIGIRKVLGASIPNLFGILSKEFVILVIISSAIAIPVANYFLREWLQRYEYRTTLSWWVFVLSGGGALIISVLMVSYQAIKVAVANPVKSLRTE